MTTTMMKPRKSSLNGKTRELESELRKTEKAAEKARDKEERDKAKRFSERIRSGVFLKTNRKAISLVQAKKEKKIS